MIVLKDKYKQTFKHSLNQEQLRLLKEQKPNYYNKYFIQK